MTAMTSTRQDDPAALPGDGTALRWSSSPTLDDEQAAFLKANAANPFERADWIRACADAEPDWRHAVVVARDRMGEIVAILPLSARRVLGATVLTWTSQDWADYCGPICTPRLRDALQGRDADEILTAAIDASGLRPDAICLRKHPERAGGGPNPFHTLAGAVLESDSGHVGLLGSDWDALLGAKLSRRGRSLLRRKRRALEDMGEVAFARITEPDRRDALAARMVAWKRAQLATRGGSDHFADPAGLAVIQASLRTPDATLFALTLDGEAIALCHCIDGQGDDGPARLLYQTSIDVEGPTATSPGTLLLVEILQASIAEGFASFDFGMGDEPYKAQWTDRSTALSSIVRARTPRGWPVTLMMRGKSLARRTIKARPAVARRVMAIRARVRGLR